MTSTSATERSPVGPAAFTVLCCRPAPVELSDRSIGATIAGEPGRAGDADSAGESGRAHDSTAAAVQDAPKVAATIAGIVRAAASNPVHFVGRRPGKSIDALLTGRILVVGDDSDLAAVVLRLLRKDRLGEVEVGYATPGGRTPVTDLWDLPLGVGAVQLAARGEVDLVPLVRDDVGGVLVGVGYLGPVSGTVYVDEHRVLRGAARRLRVVPDREKGLAVTVIRRRFAGLGKVKKITYGRAVQIGSIPTTVVRDGIPYDRQMDRWTFYKHTEPLRLVRGVY